MNAMPVLSICITYYNAPAYLLGCLDSFDRSPPAVSFEFIVVDDASPTPAGEVVRDASQVRILRMETNRGFAGANNAGIATARGKYVMLLNCDTEVRPGALDRMVEYLEAHGDAAVVGARLLNADGTFQPQCKRGRLTPLTGLAYSLGLDRMFPRNRLFGEYLMRYASPEETQDVRAVSGACMMVRRSAIETVGILDEHLVMYAEDLDWCYRFKRAGWRVVYLPTANVTHYGGRGGTHFRFWSSLYYYHRALWVLFRRHGSRWFPLYGWLIALLLTVRFAVSAAVMILTGRRRVGTPKGSKTPREAYGGTER